MGMRIFAGAVLLVSSISSSFAIPNSFTGGRFIGPIVPAHPRFGANLTRQVLSLENWERGELPGEWREESVVAGESVRRMTSMPVLFGAVPESVTAYRDDGGLREIAITYLDAGSYFGFKFGGEKTHADRESGSEKRSKFKHHYNLISRDLKKRLENGCGTGKLTTLGRSDMLRTVFTDYRWEDFVIRLARRDGHSISLHLIREVDAKRGFVREAIAGLARGERETLFAGNVATSERGDRLIESIPMSTQGHTPFCGIHTLAMAGHYYGLNLRADELAAAAEFRNTGSARGSRILDLYHAAGEEVGMDVSVSSRFDFDRVRRAVEKGMPVIVWRRVSQEREEAHARFAARLAANPLAELPPPSKSDRVGWPDRSVKGSPSHASLVNGFNAERNEVVYTEPWGEESRNRKMRVEEMEATAYAVFYFRL